MKRLSICGAVLVFGVLLGASQASAEVLQLRAEVLGGGAGGTAFGGDAESATDNVAFHDGATGATYGAAVGLEFLFIDGWIQHNQYHASDGLVGTWTQFMAGLDVDFDLGKKTRDAKFDEQGKQTNKKAYSPAYGELGMAVGFGVGTGQQVDPPLNNAQVTDKGFLGEVRVGFGYRFNRALSLGFIVPIQAGYMFKNGANVDANDLNNHYQSVHVAAMLNFRMTFTLK
jgi:hypothetical protein